VGKSTTAVSLGAALAELEFRVLVIDLDPQGNASTGLGIRHEARKMTIYDVLASDSPIAGAVVQTSVANLYAIPSTIDLAGAEIELVSQFSRELKLRKAIEPLRDGEYDFVLLDCPPSLGLLTINALAAAEELIVPIQCEYYALEGLGQLLRNVRLVQQNVNPGLRLDGIVMTMFDPRTRLSEQVVAEVRRFFGERVYETIIPRTVRLSEAPGFGQPITIYDPKSRGAECYRDLAREVALRAPIEEPMPAFEELPTVTVPPIEPPARSAPRPVRRAVDQAPLAGPEPEGERSLDETVVAPTEDLGDASESPEVIAQGGPISKEEVEIPVGAVPAQMRSDRSVETSPTHELAADGIPAGTPDIQAKVEAEASAVGVPPQGETAGRPENRLGDPAEAVVPRGQDADGLADGLAEGVSPDGEPGNSEEGAPSSGPAEEAQDLQEAEGRHRRRWGLFHRGGSR
jgi:chromosome partitioning protein